MLAAPFIQKVPIVGNKQWNSMKIGEKIDLTFPKIEMISGEANYFHHSSNFRFGFVSIIEYFHDDAPQLNTEVKITETIDVVK